MDRWIYFHVGPVVSTITYQAIFWRKDNNASKSNDIHAGMTYT